MHLYKITKLRFFNAIHQFDSNLVNLIEREFIKFHLNSMTYN